MMMSSDKPIIEEIAIFMSPTEAERFKLFQKYHKLFTELEKAQVLEIGFGKVTINIAFKEVQNIVKEEVVYKK